VSEEKPKMSKAFDGKARVRKKTTGRKLMEVFFSDEIPNLGDYILYDLLVPELRDMVADMWHNCVDMLFYGKNKRGAGRRVARGGGGTIVTYDQMSTSKNANITRSSRRSVYDVMDVIFDDRGSAELVLDQMIDYISRYKEASVHDFYDACEVSDSSTNYNDNYYGWKDLRGAIVTRASGGGWVINMPEPQQLR